LAPLLSFIGGCEFSYLIEELIGHPDKYFEFNCSHTYPDSGATDAYLYVMENADAVIAENADAVIISQVDAIRQIMQSIQFHQVSSREEQESQISEIAGQCETMIKNLSPLKVPVILQYFPASRVNLLNRFKPNAATYNESQMLVKYVTAMEELSVKYPNFYFMDLSNVCAVSGYWKTLKRFDPPWHQHLTSPAVDIAEEFTHWINYVLRKTKKIKCVICDLDNTMWNGVIRDVGVENLEVRSTVERFRWNALRILNTRGILIGFISKNDPYLADDVNSFIGSFIGPIKPVCLELSWDDKWQVLKKVQERLNIGMDSIFFVDDNEFERDQMQSMLPEVRVSDENIFEELLYMSELQPEFVTGESKQRSKYYIQEVSRQKASETMSREDFLKQCNYKIELKRAELFDVNRITELVQRTNQLNTSIKRYTKEEVIAMGSDGEHDIFVGHVSDKFGDYGLVGVCIGQYAGDTYEIDTLLFSCRVMSRGVEDYVLTMVLTYAKEQGFSRAVLRFHKGPKNDGMRKILEKNNFSEFENSEEEVVYGLDLKTTQINPLPEWFNAAEQVEIAT
jgi:FkbH-like protein